MLKRLEAEQNDAAILTFYKLYENLNLQYNYSPSQVWNCDETGSSQRETASHIVEDRKQRSNGGKISSKSLHIPMLVCVSAAGKHSPPLFILKNEETDICIWDDALPNSMKATSKNAFFDA